MTDQPIETCGDIYGSYEVNATCELPKNHDGEDHRYTLTWPRREWAHREPTALDLAREAMWAPILKQQLTLPFIPNQGGLEVDET